jgi:hypothetical protein
MHTDRTLVPLFALLICVVGAPPIGERPLYAQEGSPSSGEGASASGDGESSKPQIPNLRGWWAQKQVTSSVSKIPVVGKSISDTTSLVRLHVEQDGRDLKITQDVCSVDIQNRSSKVRTIIPRAFVRSLPKRVMDGRVEKKGGKWYFVKERDVGVRGARLRHPRTENLPDEPDDPRVYDQDKDGHPGMTVEVEGAIEGEIYLVQRGWNRMRLPLGASMRPRHLDGALEWNSDQKILDASSVFLEFQPDSRPNPKSGSSYVRSTRLAKKYSCRAIRNAGDSLFER